MIPPIASRIPLVRRPKAPVLPLDERISHLTGLTIEPAGASHHDLVLAPAESSTTRPSSPLTWDYLIWPRNCAGGNTGPSPRKVDLCLGTSP